MLLSSVDKCTPVTVLKKKENVQKNKYRNEHGATSIQQHAIFSNQTQNVSTNSNKTKQRAEFYISFFFIMNFCC